MFLIRRDHSGLLKRVIFERLDREERERMRATIRRQLKEKTAAEPFPGGNYLVNREEGRSPSPSRPSSPRRLRGWATGRIRSSQLKGWTAR